jgi:hypothetical protein
MYPSGTQLTEIFISMLVVPCKRHRVPTFTNGSEDSAKGLAESKMVLDAHGNAFKMGQTKRLRVGPAAG